MSEENKKYRVSINLVKQYEVYVEAKSVAGAEQLGRELIEAGEGDLVDDYYQDTSLKAELLHPYIATQDIVLHFEHHLEASGDTAARLYAQRQFMEDAHSALASVYAKVDKGPIKLERKD